MMVELIYDSDCPNVQKARTNLVRALAAAGQEARWTEWDRGATESPTHVVGFGSPTILVHGKDVAGVGAVETSSSCRLYWNETGGFGGAPSVEEIAAALQNSDAASAEALRTSSGWRSYLTAVPGVAIAFLPKLVCPACWPAYAGLLSAIGLGFLLNRRYLFVLTAAFLALAAGALAFHARTQRGYGPFAVGLAAAVVVLVGKFGIESNPAMYAGIAGLVAASVWNAWPAGARIRCPACRTEPSLEVNSSFEKET